MRPGDIWKALPRLAQPGFPLEGYKYLADSVLIDVFVGSVAKVQGYVAYKPESKQLVVAFSGTSSGSQAISDLKSWHVSYPATKPEYKGCSVHAGFWSLYSGVQDLALGTLKRGAEAHDVSEVVITGHSMGGCLAYLFALELLGASASSRLSLPTGVTLNIAVFGAPRLGNKQFAQIWGECVKDYRHRHGDDRVKENSVRGYMDGKVSRPSR